LLVKVVTMRIGPYYCVLVKQNFVLTEFIVTVFYYTVLIVSLHGQLVSILVNQNFA